MTRCALITIRFSCLTLSLWVTSGLGAAEIQPASDAPQPLVPEESARRVRVPRGFRFELVASEPLIQEPSGVCWDEHGRLYVCELHGYNLEGHLDVQELNRTGELDRMVRRVQANERAKRAAQAGTYGVVKLLADTDGDGRMDRTQVFAEGLPPCYGIVPARGGLIVACAPDIVFLADRDGDGRAEVRETLFTGFKTGALERGINAPQWGLDDWIYFGRGNGGNVTGPHLARAVSIGSDFRIKSDGSAIENITGSTHTFGHAFTELGDRWVATTSVPGLFVTPLPWSYIARNPDAASPRTEQPASDYTRVYPLAAPHPWRVKRADDPGFFKYYRDRYGTSDSEAGGFFTSGCGPLVYQDVAFPPEYRGHYFMCEPAQNLIHHALPEREGPGFRLRRPAGEEQSEFLASSDQWFHPIQLTHGPEGAIYIVDFYREIIEDYSAVPRYLQQQYGLIRGMDHGRIWRLTHAAAPRAPSPDMAGLSLAELSSEVASPHLWRRQTARRLLVERREVSAQAALSRLARTSTNPAAQLNAWFTLEALGRLRPADAVFALSHPNYGVRRQALRFAEPWIDGTSSTLEPILALTNETDPAVLLQLACTLGESRDLRVVPALAWIARQHGDIRWMPEAILTSLPQRGGEMLRELFRGARTLGRATAVLEPLAASIGARADEEELTRVLTLLAEPAGTNAPALALCLRGLQSGLKSARPRALAIAGQEAMTRLLGHPDAEVRRRASAVAAKFRILDPAQRRQALKRDSGIILDLNRSVEERLAAVVRLRETEDQPTAAAAAALVQGWAANTPRVQEAILDALIARHDFHPALLDAVEQERIPAPALTAFQRVTLLESDQPDLRRRATERLRRFNPATDETYQRFAAALRASRDLAHGQQVFRDQCATCHQARGLGSAVGPDLGAEFQRAEETILRDILAPNDTLLAGYPTSVIEVTGGQRHTGILASESATSVTLRQPAGVEQVILRKDIVGISTLPVSLMPEGLKEVLAPQDAADVIAWLRGESSGPPEGAERRVLFDDEPEFIAQLTQGDGQATLEHSSPFAGKACLRMTPLQRQNPRLPGWTFPIRQQPKPGEFRYLRLAWKATEGEGRGVMLELADSGRWPDAKEPNRRYFAGKNTTPWEARQISPTAPAQWQVVTLDLWKDNGPFVLTGLAPTALGGAAWFDRIELLRTVEAP